MPIFMDRHDMRDLTAERVAEAHRKDLEIQDRYGVKYLTYWYDSERCTGFCLVDAPDAATAAHVHREAHGEIPSEIIPVDLATVEAFLGRISDPWFANGVPVSDMDPGLRAIMVTDIVASTELTTRLGDLAALKLVRVHDALVRRGLGSYAGHEVKHTGDGIMAVFNNAANAVRAAADIQRRFWGRLYLLKIVEADQPRSVELSHGRLILHVRPSTDSRSCSRSFCRCRRIQGNFAIANTRTALMLMRRGAAMRTRPVGGCTLRWTFLMSFRTTSAAISPSCIRVCISTLVAL